MKWWSTVWHQEVKNIQFFTREKYQQSYFHLDVFLCMHGSNSCMIEVRGPKPWGNPIFNLRKFNKDLEGYIGVVGIRGPGFMSLGSAGAWTGSTVRKSTRNPLEAPDQWPCHGLAAKFLVQLCRFPAFQFWCCEISCSKLPEGGYTWHRSKRAHTCGDLGEHWSNGTKQNYHAAIMLRCHHTVPLKQRTPLVFN